MDSRNEFQYVYQACAGKIHPAAITDLLSVPEFIDELRKFKGKMNNDALFDIADRVYKDARIKRNSTEFKHNIIAEFGIEAWLSYKKRYSLLSNGYRKARLSIKE